MAILLETDETGPMKNRQLVQPKEADHVAGPAGVVKGHLASLNVRKRHVSIYPVRWGLRPRMRRPKGMAFVR